MIVSAIAKLKAAYKKTEGQKITDLPAWVRYDTMPDRAKDIIASIEKYDPIYFDNFTEEMTRKAVERTNLVIVGYELKYGHLGSVRANFYDCLFRGIAGRIIRLQGEEFNRDAVMERVVDAMPNERSGNIAEQRGTDVDGWNR